MIHIKDNVVTHHPPQKININCSYGVIEGTTNIYPQNFEKTLYVSGDQGTVKIGGNSVNIIEEWLFADHLDDSQEVKAKYYESLPTVYSFGHMSLYADVIEAIKQDREPYVTAEDSRRVLEIILAIYKSAVEKKSLPLSLQKASSLDFINFLHWVGESGQNHD